jgi:DNA mismatch endonuclease, patch repair protein
MADVVSVRKRSLMMAGIRSKNTTPEKTIRSVLHKLGFRFRNHVKALPGNPDIVLRKYNAVLFVHGCFWHSHSCHLFKLPATKTEFWRSKLKGNIERDRIVIHALQLTGWRVGVVWECALKGKKKLDIGVVGLRLDTWLRSQRSYLEIGCPA